MTYTNKHRLLGTNAKPRRGKSVSGCPHMETLVMWEGNHELRSNLYILYNGGSFFFDIQKFGRWPD